MPLLLPRPFGGNPYPGSRGQKHSKAQQEASSPASSGARTTAGRYTDVDWSIVSQHLARVLRDNYCVPSAQIYHPLSAARVRGMAQWKYL